MLWCLVITVRAPFPKLQKLDINCPIKQLVFGTRGSYRCMLVEQKPLTAYEFRCVIGLRIYTSSCGEL